MNIIQHTKEVIRTVRQQTNRAILFYSCGKDSITLIDLMSKEFDEVICVFMYFVKGLDHVEIFIKDLQKRYPNVKVIQKPHWNLTYIHKTGLYCVPDPKIKLKKLKDIDEEVRAETGIEWSFFGMKKADSLHRRVMLMGYENESINEKTQKAYPLSLWRNGEVLAYIKNRNLPSPIIYGKKASNGIGFNVDCLLFLRDRFPGDYERIINAYPMSEVILYQYDQQNGVK
ncbi:sulfate adenylyltransferase subunit 2 [Sphingobacterium spiritivorum]|uniref:Sulfate adenylyltransferase subunit 2 n=1 Tax=Sphingobacterium spiritivorum TaxID=258 RepID=A0A380CEI4_SPHSI|nr:phosphoadenosine phosphosulfate reductase family protein [Sphingobacterium spiritivorum]SUJ19209.1 sulfate adenylyltransferase subunit 2 [Sphingobacterium spiritivorum]